MQDLVEMIAKKLVEHPDDVQVTCVEDEEGQNFELRVHEDDMGRVIGRNGRTAKAMRTLLSAAAAKAETEVNLDIVE